MKKSFAITIALLYGMTSTLCQSMAKSTCCSTQENSSHSCHQSSDSHSSKSHKPEKEICCCYFSDIPKVLENLWQSLNVQVLGFWKMFSSVEVKHIILRWTKGFLGPSPPHSIKFFQRVFPALAPPFMR
ncbi:MAG: hypothetical protein HYS07_08870 [Chlamydiae bacterium]|nr:hypothetical protein [Chlamydiota bacterium]MBI3277010.1 hypothetical protein [Chlamydiota bacterium]